MLIMARNDAWSVAALMPNSVKDGGMKTIHYIVLGAKSPQGRGFIQGLAARGLPLASVTAIDIKSGVMSFGENDTLQVVQPDVYRSCPSG